MQQIKLILIFLIAVYAGAFLFFNTRNNADVWLFVNVNLRGVSVLLVMLFTAALTLLLWWSRGVVLRMLRGRGKTKS